MPAALVSRVAIGAAVASVALTAVGASLLLANGSSLFGGFDADLIVAGAVYGVVGGLIASRVPRNATGWFLLLGALLFSADLAVEQYAVRGLLIVPGSLPLATAAGWLSAWLWIPGNALILSGVPLVFPDGRLLSPRWRVVAAIVVGAVAVDTSLHALVAWGYMDDITVVMAPGYDPSSTIGMVGALISLGDLTVFLGPVLLTIAALGARYRASHGVARLQMRWATWAYLTAAVLIVAEVVVQLFLPQVVGVLSGIGLTLVPVAIATAILRYHLFEIDRIISRTIGWAAVSGILVAVFAGAVVGLQALLAGFTQGQTLAVAASTLLAAAAFQPVRRRVQRAVDRRFDRARYDADATAALFGSRLRDQIDLPALEADVMRTVESALRPASTAVWIRKTG